MTLTPLNTPSDPVHPDYHPVLTICVPAYNIENFISRCLESLALPDLADDLEVIVVHDGGKDKTLSIANEFKTRYPHIFKVIDKENGGHGSAINKGIEQSRGTYFKVVDGDDWVNPNDLKQLVCFLRNHQADLIITDYTIEHTYNHSKERILYSGKDFNVMPVDQLELPRKLDMHATCYRTGILKDNNIALQERVFYVDCEFVTLPLPFVQTAAVLPLNIYHYFIGRPDQSVNLPAMVKNVQHHEKVVYRILSFYPHVKSGWARRMIYARLMAIVSTHYFLLSSAERAPRRVISRIDEFELLLKNNCPDLYEDLGKKIFFRILRSGIRIDVLVMLLTFPLGLRILNVIQQKLKLYQKPSRQLKLENS